MKDFFFRKPEVEKLFKEAVLSQTYNNKERQEVGGTRTGNPSTEELSVKEVLHQHAYDMDISLMRSIISQAASPPKAISNKDGRRNWYSRENCPDWWTRTGLPFQSVNHAPSGSKKLTKIPLMSLIESLQTYLGITPNGAKKTNKTSYVSCFLYAIDDAAAGVDPANLNAGEDPMDDIGVDTTDDIGEDPMDDIGVDTTDDVGVDTTDDVGVDTTDDVGVDTTDDVGVDPMDNVGVDPMDDIAPTDEIAGEDPMDDVGVDPMDGIAPTYEIAGEDLVDDEDADDIKCKIRNIFEEDSTWEEKSLKIMRLVDTWDDLMESASTIMGNIPDFPKQLSNNWIAPQLLDVNKKYCDFIPKSIGNRMVLQSTPNGNCIFNAISILMYGNESMAMMLKVAAVANMVDQLIPFTKYIIEEFRGDISLWVSSATRGYTSTGTQDPTDIEGICRVELLETLKHPYMDGSLFHLHLLTSLLRRPIQQHCIKKHYDSYRQLLFPPLEMAINPAPLHLVWVPVKPRSVYATINHVVPAVGPDGTNIEESY
nr:uncharacterized protein LOC105347498 isoform X2 [Crassostrea gigas]